MWEQGVLQTILEKSQADIGAGSGHLISLDTFSGNPKKNMCFLVICLASGNMLSQLEKIKQCLNPPIRVNSLPNPSESHHLRIFNQSIYSNCWRRFTQVDPELQETVRCGCGFSFCHKSLWKVPPNWPTTIKRCPLQAPAVVGKDVPSSFDKQKSCGAQQFPRRLCPFFILAMGQKSQYQWATKVEAFWGILSPCDSMNSWPIAQLNRPPLENAITHMVVRSSPCLSRKEGPGPSVPYGAGIFAAVCQGGGNQKTQAGLLDPRKDKHTSTLTVGSNFTQKSCQPPWTCHLDAMLDTNMFFCWAFKKLTNSSNQKKDTRRVAVDLIKNPVMFGSAFKRHFWGGPGRKQWSEMTRSEPFGKIHEDQYMNSTIQSVQNVKCVFPKWQPQLTETVEKAVFICFQEASGQKTGIAQKFITRSSLLPCCPIPWSHRDGAKAAFCRAQRFIWSGTSHAIIFCPSEFWSSKIFFQVTWWIIKMSSCKLTSDSQAGKVVMKALELVPDSRLHEVLWFAVTFLGPKIDGAPQKVSSQLGFQSDSSGVNS